MELPRSFVGAPALTELPADVVRTVRGLTESEEPVAAYLYDLRAARDRASALRKALPDWMRVYYAVKANSYPPLVRGLAGVVDGFEIASVSEARLAVEASGRPSLAASGPGKTEPFLRELAELPADVVVNVESQLELRRLSAAAGAAGTTVAVALRVNPERVPIAGALTMGGVPGPFGIPEADIDTAVTIARKLPGLDLVGFHVHAVSGNLDAAAHVAYVRWCLGWAERAALRLGVELRHIDVGGGLGIPFEPGDAEFDLGRFGAGLATMSPPYGASVVVEPGRWLAGPVGWYATEVTDVKQSYGACFAVVRGGINHFQLPTSWDIRHNFAVVLTGDQSRSEDRPYVRDCGVTVVGELCTPEDVLARDVTVPVLRAGDVLVFPNAGAYGFEFAMPAFLGHPPARRLLIDRG